MNLFHRLRSYAVRLKRLPRSRGFGVQSPSDYRFITGTLRKKMPDAVCRELPRDEAIAAFLRLVYLVSADRKPRSTLNMTSCRAVDDFVIHAKEDCIVENDICLEKLCKADLIILDAGLPTVRAEEITSFLPHISPSAYMIVANINGNAACSALWRHIVNDNRAVITFDLFSAGVVLFDRKRYKQRYKIYF